jgi:ParB family transcriptional regulator, chromosome partitioning protein
MTMATGNVARESGKKVTEKAELRSSGRTGASAAPQPEKRRALGRGLESLLPGPRMVPPVPAGSHPVPPSSVPGSRAGVPAPQIIAATGDQQVPHGRFAAVRNDIVPEPVRNDVAGGDRLEGMIRAGVDRVAEEEATKPPLLAKPARSGAPESTAMEESAYLSPVQQQVPHRPAPVRNDITPELVRNDIGGESGDGIEIMAMVESRTPSNLVLNLALEQIDKNPFQTRYVDDNENLEELAESIKANGVVQPIVVRPAAEDGRFILILGERRLHASKKAGKETIPALVRRVSDQQAAEMTIIENLQREDLSPLEHAEAFRVLSQEFKMTQQQIGERVGLSRQSVANYMRLLKLPREVMQMLAEKRLTFDKAKALLSLSTDDQISHAALHAVKNGMNIEQIETLVLSMSGDESPFPGVPGAPKKSSGARWVDPNVRAAQVDLERLLGVRVRIRDRKGKGKIVIEYSTVDDYERVVEMLRGKK